jgi:hypothetical protein
MDAIVVRLFAGDCRSVSSRSRLRWRPSKPLTAKTRCNTHYYKGFIQLGYGIDPIPAKTLSQRWHERASRGLPSQMGFFHRDDAPPPRLVPSDRPVAGKSGDARPSARRVRDPVRPQPTR